MLAFARLYPDEVCRVNQEDMIGEDMVRALETKYPGKSLLAAAPDVVFEYGRLVFDTRRVNHFGSAFDFLKKAAESDIPDAQVCRVLCCFNGSGSACLDLDAAYAHYKKAYDARDSVLLNDPAYAAYLMGKMIADGQYTGATIEEAIDLLNYAIRNCTNRAGPDFLNDAQAVLDRVQ
jgi:TPR repeat protein